MVYNLKKMFGKKFATFFLILSIFSTAFYSPVFTPRAQAFLGFGDLTIDIKQLVRGIADGYAMTLAQQMVDDIVRSTVDWANSGFEGNPAFVTNPQQYFTDIADGIAGEFIAGSDLNFLCSPFQTQVRLALQQSYTQPRQYQCTFSESVGNIQAFYDDFNQGGWDAWYEVTQNNANNPYGAYLEAELDLNSRIAESVNLKKEQLDWSSGFLSYEKCLGTEVLNNQTGQTECIGAMETVTPGVTIKGQLDKVLPSGLEKLVRVEHIEQLISSFASGLLNRYVFGSRGLFARGAGANNNQTIVDSRTGKLDLDGDGVPEGQDADQDGTLTSPNDTCYHGGRAPNCVPSSTVTNSPYFTPVCQAVDRAVLTLKEFDIFINKYSDQIKGNGVDFKNPADSDIWGSRASEVNSAVDEVLSGIQSYRHTYFDSMEIGTNRFSVYIGKVLQSLLGDGRDLDLAIKGNGGGGIDKLKDYVKDNLSYFEDIKGNFGACGNPNIFEVRETNPPEVPVLTTQELEVSGICATPEEVADFLFRNPGDESRLRSGFPCSGSGSGSNDGSTLSCAPSSQAVAVGELASFSVSGGDGNYTWAQNDGTPPTGSGSNWSTMWFEAFEKVVVVTDGNGSTSQCQVYIQ